MCIKTTALIVALGVVPVFGSAIVMADGPATAEEELDIAAGTVTAIDRDNTQFSLEVATLDRIEVSWNDDTAFTLDGEASTLDEVLVIQRMVTVEHADGLAVKVHGVSEDDLPGAPE